RRAEAEGGVVEALAVAEPKLREGNPHDPELISAMRKAEAQLASGVVRVRLQDQVKEMLADVAMLEKLEQILLDQAATDVKTGQYDTAGADAVYARAFREYGIDLEALAVQEAAAQIRLRAIAMHLAAALDTWALAPHADTKRLLAVARE